MDKFQILVRQVVEQGKFPHTAFAAPRKFGSECVACCMVHALYP
jgi:hypothetical protein